MRKLEEEGVWAKVGMGWQGMEVKTWDEANEVGLATVVLKLVGASGPVSQENGK